MKLEEHVKIDIVKAFTEALKIRRGKGPRNIYIKVIEGEIKVICEGVLNELEKYIFNTYGKVQVDHYEKLWHMDIVHMEKAIQERIKFRNDVVIENSHCDMVNDKFTYIIAFT